MELEDMVALCHANRTNIDLLYNDAGSNDNAFGVRLRFYGKPELKDKMCLGCGGTVADALYSAVLKAKGGRFESLDFKARPWAQPTETGNFQW